MLNKISDSEFLSTMFEISPFLCPNKIISLSLCWFTSMGYVKCTDLR